MTAVKHYRKSGLTGTPTDGDIEYVLAGGSYIQYLTDLGGSRIPPAVLAHEHDDRYLKRDGSNLMSGSVGISRNTAVTASDYLSMFPTDYGAGKPRLAVTKMATANLWHIGLWDGSSSAGTINFVSTNLQHNGNQIWHAGNITPVPTSRTVTGVNSIFGGGALSANQTFQLHGDVAAPGNNKMYATNSSGTRGWYDVPVAGISEATANARYVYKDGSTVMSGSMKISTNIASVGADYLVMFPVDYGAGNPRLAVASLATANHWQIGLWDGSSSSGRINFASGELTHNGNFLATQSWVTSQGYVTGGPYVPTSRTLQFTANDGLNVSGTPISDLSGNRTVTFGISGIDTSKITSGTLSVARGGTGLNSFGSPGQVIMTNGSSNYWGTVSGGVSGSGTTSRIPLWNSGTNLTDSAIQQDGSGNIGIGGINSSYKLYVSGWLNAGEVHTAEVTSNRLYGSQYLWLGSGGSMPSSTIMWVNTTTKGSMPFPRHTTSQWNAIADKDEALCSWNSDEHGLMWWDGSRTAIIRFNGTKYQGWTGSSWADFH